jgi:hypothetical protein
MVIVILKKASVCAFTCRFNSFLRLYAVAAISMHLFADWKRNNFKGCAKRKVSGATICVLIIHH